jgi:hypothetical protein
MKALGNDRAYDENDRDTHQGVPLDCGHSSSLFRTRRTTGCNTTAAIANPTPLTGNFRNGTFPAVLPKLKNTATVGVMMPVVTHAPALEFRSAAGNLVFSSSRLDMVAFPLLVLTGSTRAFRDRRVLIPEAEVRIRFAQTTGLRRQRCHAIKSPEEPSCVVRNN